MGLSVRRLDFRFWLLLFLDFPGGSEVALAYYQPLPMSLFHSSSTYQTSWVFLHLSSPPCSNMSSFPIIFSRSSWQPPGHIQFFNISKSLLSQKCCVFCPLGLGGFPLCLSWLRILLQYDRPGLDHWVGKTSWRRAWQPTPVFWPVEPMDCIVHWVAKSQTRLSDFHFQA